MDFLHFWGKKSHLVKLSYFLKILLGLNCQYFVRKKDVDVHVTFELLFLCISLFLDIYQGVLDHIAVLFLAF